MLEAIFQGVRVEMGHAWLDPHVADELFSPLLNRHHSPWTRLAEQRPYVTGTLWESGHDTNTSCCKQFFVVSTLSFYVYAFCHFGQAGWDDAAGSW